MDTVQDRLIVAVGKELSADLTHRHLAWLVTDLGRVVTVDEVYRDLIAGTGWSSTSEGITVPLRPRFYCPQPGCLSSPYVQTNLDSDGPDNLESLPEV